MKSQAFGRAVLGTLACVGPAGDDIYAVHFEHGTHEIRILLNADGRIYSAQFSA
jgi:hypothetical protein